MTKCFKKSAVNAIFGPFRSFLVQNRIFLKILFLPISLILKYHCAKLKKNQAVIKLLYNLGLELSYRLLIVCM